MRTGTGINDPERSLRPGRAEAGQLPRTDPGGVREVTERHLRAPQGDPGARNTGAIMTSNPRSCRPGETLAAAAVAMCEADCRFLPVVDEAGCPVGALTDGDICVIGATSHRTLSEVSVRDAMSHPPVICHPEDSVLDTLHKMRERRIRHVPVVGADGLLEGVVSLTDVLLEAVEEGPATLRWEVAAALRDMTQKLGGRRVIEHNPFVED